MPQSATAICICTLAQSIIVHTWPEGHRLLVSVTTGQAPLHNGLLEVMEQADARYSSCSGRAPVCATNHTGCAAVHWPVCPPPFWSRAAPAACGGTVASPRWVPMLSNTMLSRLQLPQARNLLWLLLWASIAACRVQRGLGSRLGLLKSVRLLLARYSTAYIWSQPCRQGMPCHGTCTTCQWHH
jgi:hypothetical protein